MNIDDLDQRDNASIDNALASFERKLGAIVARAQTRTLVRIQERLAVTNGVIDSTAGNQAVLRSLDTVFNQEMATAGFSDLVDAFVGTFGRQFDRFDKVLKSLGMDAVTFTQAEKGVYASLQLNAVDQIHGAIARTAEAARQAALFSVGGVRVTDLAELIADKMDAGLQHATGVAETALTTFYRNISARGFEKLAAAGVDLRFRYFGPRDKLNRPFCRRLLEDGRAFTRQEIDRLDNGQLPNVFITCGGYRCRHQWLPLAPQAAPVSAPPQKKAEVIAIAPSSPIPAVPPAAKKTWDAGEAGTNFLRWVESAGIPAKEYAARVEAHLANLMRKAEIFIRVKPDDFPKILADGRFKNQHETGTSGGALNKPYRALVERKVMGVKAKSKPADHPIYGYYSDDLERATSGVGNGASFYGSIIVRLKSGVRERATFTVGDSLNHSRIYKGTKPIMRTLPSPVTSPSYRTARYQKDVEAVKRVTALSEEYVEAQVFGGVEVSDIEEVLFERPNAYEKFRPELERRGIRSRLIDRPLK